MTDFDDNKPAPACHQAPLMTEAELDALVARERHRPFPYSVDGLEVANALTALRAERDELRAAIFGSGDYCKTLRNGNFAEMAQATEAGRKGAIARAEAAEARVARVAELNSERAAAYNRGYADCLYSAGQASTPEVEPVTLIYTNWKGETGPRRIIPRRIWWGSTEWHPEPQWLITAFDMEKEAERDFALADFHGTEARALAAEAAAYRDAAVMAGRKLLQWIDEADGKPIPYGRDVDLCDMIKARASDAARETFDSLIARERAALADARREVSFKVSLGMRGEAYDGPGDARAYTYSHQPGNMRASKIGEAAAITAQARCGDYIDSGLVMLRELQSRGFGVFTLVSGPGDIAARVEGESK